MSGDAAAITALALAIGILLSLVCYLVTNLSPGGMITPGWLALALVNEPRRLLLILGIVALTYLVVSLLNRVVILYGKRLFAVVVLVAVFLQVTSWLLLAGTLPQLFGFTTLGFIVPGLIAYQFHRQPAGATLLATITVTATSYTLFVSGVLLRLLPGPEDIGALEGFSSTRVSPGAIVIMGIIAVAGIVAMTIRFRRVSRSMIPVPGVEQGAVEALRSSDPLRYIAESERPRSDDEP